jgi:hypothetical protein
LLSAAMAKNYRLPSEAEWEHACVFPVDLIRFVLFLIDPVRCNGGIVDLNLSQLFTAPALSDTSSAGGPGDRPDLIMTPSNWPTPYQSQQP